MGGYMRLSKKISSLGMGLILALSANVSPVSLAQAQDKTEPVENFKMSARLNRVRLPDWKLNLPGFNPSLNRLTKPWGCLQTLRT